MTGVEQIMESSQDLASEQAKLIRAGAEKAAREKATPSESVDQLRFLSVDDLLILMHLSQSGLSVTEVAAKLK